MRATLDLPDVAVAPIRLAPSAPLAIGVATAPTPPQPGVRDDLLTGPTFAPHALSAIAPMPGVPLPLAPRAVPHEPRAALWAVPYETLRLRAQPFASYFATERATRSGAGGGSRLD